MIIGLTGGIGSGKTTVCKLFAKLGVPVISADEIAHDLLKTNHAVYQAVRNKFGEEFLDAKSNIDRHKLRARIFSAEDEKLWLEQLLHPLIKEEIIERTKNIVYPYCVVEIPLLVEVGWQDLVDRILTIDCTEELQLARATARDGTVNKQIANVIANQITREKRRTASNDIIENAGDLKTLQQHVEQMHHHYLELASFKGR